MSELTASRVKMFVRPIIAITLTCIVGYEEVFSDGVGGSFLTLYAMIMSFYFGESAGARIPGQETQE